MIQNLDVIFNGIQIEKKTILNVNVYFCVKL